MLTEWLCLPLEQGPLEIIDGDRGKNYPKRVEMSASGFCLFLNAGNVTKDGFSFSDCSFISTTRDELLRKGKLKRQDVVLTTRGTVGNVAFYNSAPSFEHIRINSGMVILRADQRELLPEYLYQFMRSNVFRNQMRSLTTGSAQPQLPIRDINRIEMPLPPLPEQKDIAHILGALDDKIELNRQMNQTLEAMARAIFKSWFVDFDPVHAKLARSDDRRSHVEGSNGEPYPLDTETLALFPDRFVDSELGEIPEGWEVGTIAGIAKITSGKRPNERSNEQSEEMSVPLFGGGGQMAYVSEPLYTQPFVLTGRVGTLGKIFRISFPCWPSDNTLIAFPNESQQFEYLYFCMNRIDFGALNRGSTQPLVTQGDLKQQPFVVPDSRSVEAFHEIVVSLFKKCDANDEESRTLAELRDTLLPKLISGELRVPEVENMTEELTA